MKKLSAAIAVFDTHDGAEVALTSLEKAGFDMKALSIVGKGYHTEEAVVGYYNTADRMKYWGKNGAFWGGFWGLLFGSAVFVIPGMGPLLAGGPAVAWIVGALEGAAVVGSVSVIGAALASIGIPKDSILQYDVSVKAGKFMLVVNGTDEEVARASALLTEMDGAETQVFYADALEEVLV